MRDLRLGLCAAMSVVVVCWTALAGAQQADHSPTTRPAVAIYVVAGMPAPTLEPAAPAGPKVILAAWEDGQIIWSEHAIRGGPPYRTGRFDPKSLTQLTGDLGKQGAFEKQELTRPHYGPDSSYTVIRIVSGRQRLELRSWHELCEQNPKLIATAGGITALDGRDRDEVLRSQPVEYREYRSIWSGIRTATKSWIPRDSKPWEGAPRID